MNGTVGLYEDENYRHGTEFILKELEQNNGNIIAGGGDAVASVNKLGYEDAFDFLSTGGGATLDYIATGKLKCYEEN
jgi:phosphoglycerate kinase